MYRTVHHSTKSTRIFQIFSASLVLLLVLETSIVLLLDPGNLLGNGDIIQRFFTMLFIFTHDLRGPLLVLSEVLLVALLILVLLRPITLLLYLHTIQRQRKREEDSFYFALTTLPNLTLDNMYIQSDAAHINSLSERIPVLELAEEQQDHHILFLGVPGAGKTTVLKNYQRLIAQHRWKIIRGREKIPLYIPMNDYSLFLKEDQLSTVEDPLESILLQYLYSRKNSLPGIQILYPYLSQFVEQGRLLLLCDGLNEVDSSDQQYVCNQLIQMMDQGSANRLVMTCREVDARDNPLNVLVNQETVKCVIINPLALSQIEGFIEKYTATIRRKQHCSPEKILAIIDQNNLRLHCTNPMILSRLIRLVEEESEEDEVLFPTRGLLLEAFVLRQVQREQLKWKDAPDEITLFAFLGELACAARGAGERTAVQLSPTSRMSRKKRIRGLIQADHLYTWLIENPALSPIVIGQSESEEDDQYAYASLDPLDRADLINFAIDANLIEIDINGKLTFKHEIIAEYFVAYYFLHCDKKTSGNNALNKELFADNSWYEPVVIWAELIDAPRALAQRIAIFGKQHPELAAQAATLSLNCLGIQPSLSPSEDPLPSEVTDVVTIAVQDASHRKKLADNFNKYAQKGGQKVYYALLPILTLPHVEDLLVQLNSRDVVDLLFNHLGKVSDTDALEKDTNSLIRVLSRYGNKSAEFNGIIIQHAESLLKNSATSRGLCEAIISILGDTHTSAAIQLLLSYLRRVNNDYLREQVIRRLSSQEPGRIVGNLIQILQTTTPSPNLARLHVDTLEILRRLLAQQQISLPQLQRIMNVAVVALSEHYNPHVRQKARTLLQEQCKAASSNTQGQEVLKTVIQNLSMKDTRIAGALVAILTNVGPLATPYLLEELHQTAKKNVYLLILDIFAATQDPQALPALLNMIADPDATIQQQVEKTLLAYAQKSIPGLIEQILHSVGVQVAERSAKILKEIRQGVVTSVIEKLQPVIYGRTYLLVETLEEFNDPQIIPSLTALIEEPLSDPLLVKAITRTLGQYQDECIITPLLTLLTVPQTSFTEETQQELKDLATKGLSFLGELALDRLIGVLTAEQVSPQTIHAIHQVFYGMTPYPGEQLLERIGHIDDSKFKHVEPIFFMKGVEGAGALVKFLRHADVSIRRFSKQTLEQIPGKYSAPALVDILYRIDMREEVTPLLLKIPEAISPLVSVLADKERGDAAQTILLLFEPEIIPELIPALDHPNKTARERASTILVTWGRQQPATIEKIIQLLKPDLPVQAYETLTKILAHDLAPMSIPFLFNALEHDNLIEKIGGVLQHLMQGRYSGEIRDGLREALLTEHLRRGARDVLMTLKEEAISIVGDLVTDSKVGKTVRMIIGELGGAALPFIWQTVHDPSKQEYRSDMLSIFHTMDTADIRQPLIQLLTAPIPQKVVMGLGLLLERVQGDQATPGTKKEIIPAILEHIYESNDEQTTLRIIAWLLFLGGPTTIPYIAQALQNHPRRYEPLIRTLLLLGADAENKLLELLQQPTTQANAHLKAEVIGVLGMLNEYQQVTRYALNLNKYGYDNTGRINNPDEMMIALHGLGGLLAGGRWNITRLKTLESSADSDIPVKELAYTLSGKLYSPIIQNLEQQLQEEKRSHQLDRETYAQQIGPLQKQSAQWEAAYKQEDAANRTLQTQYNELYKNYQQAQQTLINRTQVAEQLERDNRALRLQISQLTQQSQHWGIPPIQ